jgi:hypothetical protein
VNFEENEIEVAESIFTFTAFMGKVNINYYYLFISLRYKYNNYQILIIYFLMEPKVSHAFFYSSHQRFSNIKGSYPFDLVSCQREALIIFQPSLLKVHIFKFIKQFSHFLIEL